MPSISSGVGEPRAPQDGWPSVGDQAKAGKRGPPGRLSSNFRVRPNLVVPRLGSDSQKQSFTKLGCRLRSAQKCRPAAMFCFSKADIIAARATDPNAQGAALPGKLRERVISRCLLPFPVRLGAERERHLIRKRLACGAKRRRPPLSHLGRGAHVVQQAIPPKTRRTLPLSLSGSLTMCKR
jgi:hypothetical protein